MRALRTATSSRASSSGAASWSQRRRQVPYSPSRYARRAYLDGEYGTCLLLCDQLAAPDDDARFEVAVLRARIHIRVDRGDRALEALRNIALEALSVDQFVVVQMLSGAAYVRLGQKERGAAILREAIEKASDAHPTVRAEVSLQLGIALFRLGSYAEADLLFAGIE